MPWIVAQKLRNQLTDPIGFYNGIRSEDWRPAFVFFLWVTFIISIVTPPLNYIGIASTDFSSSYQAQIYAYVSVKNNLLGTYGNFAYLIEVVQIFILAIPFMLFITVILHLIYRGIGGRGSVSDAFKATCYGVGPCLLGGFLPYVSLFAGYYSFAMQFYMGPMTLYKARGGRAIVVFVAFIAMSFIEMFVLGKTAG